MYLSVVAMKSSLLRDIMVSWLNFKKPMAQMSSRLFVCLENGVMFLVKNEESSALYQANIEFVLVMPETEL